MGLISSPKGSRQLCWAVCIAIFALFLVLAAFHVPSFRGYTWDLSPGYGPQLTPAEYAESAFPGFLSTLKGDYSAQSLPWGSVVYETAGIPLSSIYKGSVFRPEFTATAVIAVKGGAASGITGWKSLLSGDYPVSLDIKFRPNLEYLVMAIAAGLDTQPGSKAAGSYTQAIALLKELKKQGRLSENNAEAPVAITFDYRARRAAAAQQAVAIVVPEEGTLSYTVGIFSPSGAAALSEVDQSRLVKEGYLLPGQMPGKAIDDISEFNNALPGIRGAYSRQVLGEQLFSTATYQEHLFSYFAFILMLTAWSCSFYYRIGEGETRRQFLAVSALLLFWVTLRMIKIEAFNGDLVRYLWYLFYIPMIFIPLLLFRIGLSIGDLLNGKNKKTWQGVYRFSFWLSVLLLLMVFTNDLHQLVFSFHKGVDYFEIYGYGVFYYIIAFRVFCFVIAFVIIAVVSTWKKIRVPLIPMALVFCFFIFCNVGYVLYIPVIRISEITLTYSFSALAFIEIALQSRLIPNNIKYGRLFRSAPCSVQIFSGFALAQGRAIKPEYKTAAAGILPAAFFEQLKKMDSKSPQSIVVPGTENIRYDTYPITGGIAVAGINLDKIVTLTATLKEYNKQLEEQNIRLHAAEHIKRETAEVKHKHAVYAAIDQILKEKSHELQKLLDLSEDPGDGEKKSALIRLMVNYCKRRSGLAIACAGGEKVHIADLSIILEEALHESGVSGVARFSRDFLLDAEIAAEVYDYFEQTLRLFITEGKGKTGDKSVVVYMKGEETHLEFRMVESISNKGDLLLRIFPLDTKEENHV
ncbi:histidine kinase N-terminal 7TM domain-containing protein [Leadbettera azotonutricia]|uniref:Putative membrane protein n=1 Tax=Leadbettera azotonutricia (strain ATCC BAA-888 / DSM 13862 / ZAS-9) TaxID=545695 RepID=F5Y943_LEAAZ|nr:histidine kinase N-terminal 7TM domain-containing protein [Leadbettera azotonutricia]AEF82793.1 putative membrane protein [Leadbettera azotonutricia ZAS-9]